MTNDEITKTLHFDSETGMPLYDPVARKAYVNLQDTCSDGIWWRDQVRREMDVLLRPVGRAAFMVRYGSRRDEIRCSKQIANGLKTWLRPRPSSSLQTRRLS